MGSSSGLLLGMMMGKTHESSGVKERSLNGKESSIKVTPQAIFFRWVDRARMY